MKKNIGLFIFIILIQVLGFSITYNQAVKDVFKNNPDINLMKENIKAADYSIKKTISSYFPSLDFNGRYTRIGITPEFEIPGMGSFKFGTPNNYNFRLTTQYMLYDWNRRGNLKAISEKNKTIIGNSYTLLKKNIAWTIANIFSSYNILLKSKNIFESNLNTLKEHLKSVKKRYEAGIVSSYDLLSTKVQISKTEAQILDIEKGLKNMELSLKQLLNKDENIKIDGTVELLPIKFEEKELVKIALSNREDIKNLLVQKSMIDVQKKINKTALLPIVAFQANYELRNGMLPDIDKLKSNWNLNFTIAYKIFDGFKTKYQDKILSVQETQLFLKIESLKRKIKTDIAKSLTNIFSFEKSLQKESEKLKLAEEAYRTVVKAYREGAVSNIDVLNANSNLKLAKLSILKIKNQIIMEKLKIINTIGLKFWRLK
jgi:outer membrane protein TolC